MIGLSTGSGRRGPGGYGPARVGIGTLGCGPGCRCRWAALSKESAPGARTLLVKASAMWSVAVSPVRVGIRREGDALSLTACGSVAHRSWGGQSIPSPT